MISHKAYTLCVLPYLLVHQDCAELELSNLEDVEMSCDSTTEYKLRDKVMRYLLNCSFVQTFNLQTVIDSQSVCVNDHLNHVDKS